MKRSLLIITFISVAVISGVVAALLMNTRSTKPKETASLGSLKTDNHSDSTSNHLSENTPQEVFPKTKLPSNGTLAPSSNAHSKRVPLSLRNPTTPSVSRSTPQQSVATIPSADSNVSGLSDSVAPSTTSNTSASDSNLNNTTTQNSAFPGNTSRTAEALPAANGPSNGTQSPGVNEAEVVLEVPIGAVAPIAAYDDTPRSFQQEKALERIVDEFEQDVSQPAPGITEEENWNTARKIADQRYLTLFGYQSYNQYSIEAGKEALKEKPQTSTPP